MVLRTAPGLEALAQARLALGTGSHATVGGWIAGSLALLSGILLVVGLLTPMAAVLTSAVQMWASIEGLHDLAASEPSVAVVVAVALALVLLGPGAYSLDARFFGLRQIIIPPTRSSR